MTAPHFIVGSFQGKPRHWVDYFPTLVRQPGAEQPVMLIDARYELTPGQATLSVDELKVLLDAGHLQKWEQKVSR